MFQKEIIKKSTTPIDIIISRDLNQFDYTYVNMCNINIAADSSYLKNSFTLKGKNSSIHIELKPKDTNISYVLVIKLGYMPIINSSSADYDLFKIM